MPRRLAHRVFIGINITSYDAENTFTVVVEKDGRGLGMSVCGGGGLVRIRRLYPPQPAWRTGRLAPRDLLLSANGVPLAGLSTYNMNEIFLKREGARINGYAIRVLNSLQESHTPLPPVKRRRQCVKHSTNYKKRLLGYVKYSFLDSTVHPEVICTSDSTDW
ncbi:unnamed protein product [Diatraea saccharalis]|uniref:PDZ domain-containing protein n=1 Tax=Diatraea saccharalis TaxID=40085 RepID=A0A9N9QXV1_9NEOP|nr:unnamed protein product [Diatraea saccharalis]